MQTESSYLYIFSKYLSNFKHIRFTLGFERLKFMFLATFSNFTKCKVFVTDKKKLKLDKYIPRLSFNLVDRSFESLSRCKKQRKMFFHYEN